MHQELSLPIFMPLHVEKYIIHFGPCRSIVHLYSAELQLVCMVQRYAVVYFSAMTVSQNIN